MHTSEQRAAGFYKCFDQEVMFVGLFVECSARDEVLADFITPLNPGVKILFYDNCRNSCTLIG